MATLGVSLPCWMAEPPPMSSVPRGQSRGDGDDQRERAEGGAEQG
jgi:hypothetical protein